MKKTKTRISWEKQNEGNESDTGNIVGVAEVSVQRDVLIGRSIMKFKDLEEANSEYWRTCRACAWTRSIGKWASRRSY